MDDHNRRHLQVINQLNRLVIGEYRGMDVHTGGSKQVPTQRERIGSGTHGILSVDDEGWEVVGEVIAKRDGHDRDNVAAEAINQPFAKAGQLPAQQHSDEKNAEQRTKRREQARWY